MAKAIFFTTVCLLLAMGSLGEAKPSPDPDYSEHKTVSEDTKRTSYTDSYSSYPDSGAGANAVSAYYAAPRAYYAAPRSYYPSYRAVSYPSYSYAAPRYVSYAAPPGSGYVDDNVYITDNLGRNVQVQKATSYRGSYYV